MAGYPVVSGPEPATNPALAALVDKLLLRHGSSVNAMLLYGSCLRSGDIHDGLLDLYLVCDNYRTVYRNPLLMLGNWLLAPNVFYAEVEHEGKVLRAKYGVISSADFRRGNSHRWFESYLWGRFAQPVKVVYCREPVQESRLEACFHSAARTFLSRALPTQPATGRVTQLWVNALSLSYNTELRTERAGRADELVQTSQDFFENITADSADSLAFPVSVYYEHNNLEYSARIPAHTRVMARMGWLLRGLQGKLLSLLRLLKALFTFAGGLDYIAWKLHRHSGQEVVIPERVRRWPLLFMWGFFWRLYRQGVFK